MEHKNRKGNKNEKKTKCNEWEMYQEPSEQIPITGKKRLEQSRIYRKLNRFLLNVQKEER